MRFHLVDRITAWHPGRLARGYKGFTRSDGYVDGREALPRSLVIEALAQLSSFLLGDAEARDGRHVLSLLASVEGLRWEGDLYPGERATLEAEIVGRRPEGARLAVSARVGDRPLAAGRLGFVFFMADAASREAEFAWTHELLVALAEGCEGEPPRREVFA